MVSKMIDKKEFLLNSIIRAYIKCNEPIGSKQLKSMYDLSYSSATIRGYFKKLGDEGCLKQEHISSGRIPTNSALKKYWSDRLDFELFGVDYYKLKQLAFEMDLSVFVQKQPTIKLQRVLNIEEVYIILEFIIRDETVLPFKSSSNDFAITIKYSSALYRFLNEMVNLDLNDILNIAKQVGASQLYDELNRYIVKSEFNIINVKEFLQFSVKYNLDEDLINSFLQGKIMENLQNGIYFENMLPVGYIGIVHNTYLNRQKVKMLVVGELSKDYEYFYKGVSR